MLKRSIILLVVAVLLVVTFGRSVNANLAELRVRTGTGYEVDKIGFKRVEYVGKCPGKKISATALDGQFVSSTLPPAPGRRVKIQNVTEGMKNNPYPYTDRDYSKGKYSQSFKFGIDNRHRATTLSVLEGQNKFKYEIFEQDKVVDQGNFTAGVTVQDAGVFSRGTICEKQLSCHDKSGKDKKEKGQKCYQTTKCSCPD